MLYSIRESHVVATQLIWYRPLEDTEARIFPILSSTSDQGAIFLPTRMVRTSGQENKNTNSDADFCASPLHTCTAAADCEIENTAQQKGTFLPLLMLINDYTSSFV